MRPDRVIQKGVRTAMKQEFIDALIGICGKDYVYSSKEDVSTATEKEFELIDSGNIDDYVSGGADLSQIETDIAQIKTDITDIDSAIGNIATVLDLIMGEGTYYDELSDKVDEINGEVI